MIWIHKDPKWPEFTWKLSVIAPTLATVRFAQGRLFGRIESLGFDLSPEANLIVLALDTVVLSAIEGEALAYADVRSPIARRLGIEEQSRTSIEKDVERIVGACLCKSQGPGRGEQVNDQ